MKLLQKLLEIQKAVDNFTKDKKSFGYDYASGNQVLHTIRPKMNELGLLLKQEILEVKSTRIDYVNNKGKEKSEILNEVKQKFTWIDTETSEREECMFFASGMNDWEKGLGSALTYAERYFLLKFFHVPTDNDDPDYAKQNAQTNQYKKHTTNYKEKTISETQAKRFYAIAKGKDTAKISRMLKSKGYEKAADIKIKDYDTFITEIEKMSKK